jgi:RNA 2',3'-cyclic 3'-phosphodiesterase
MAAMRMFVAVLPPTEVVEHLDEFLSVRREAAAFRWSSAEQWHVTLAFAESVPDRGLDDLDDRLARVAERRLPFDLKVSGGGAFPDPDHARVLFARLGASDDAAATLDHLAAGCRTALSSAGARVDGQRFRPHLTLGRLGRPDNVTSWVRLLDAYDGPAWTVDEVALVASHLGEGPRRRPRHEVVGTYALAR